MAYEFAGFDEGPKKTGAQKAKISFGNYKFAGFDEGPGSQGSDASLGPPQEESDLWWTGRNLAQSPFRAVAGVAGFPTDVARTFAKEAGIRGIERLKVPEEIRRATENMNPGPLISYLQQMAQEGKEMETEPVPVGLGSQDIMEGFSPLIGKQREGDWLSSGISQVLPFVATGGMPTIANLLRSGLMAGSAAAGSYLGGKTGGYLGKKVGFPETGELLGGAAGAIAGMHGTAKGVAYLKNRPSKLFKALDKKRQMQLDQIESGYERALDRIEAEHVGSKKSLDLKAKKLRAEYDKQKGIVDAHYDQIEQQHQQQLEALDNKQQQLEAGHEQIAIKNEGLEDVISGNIQQHKTKGSKLYNALGKILDTVYGGDLIIEVGNIAKDLEVAVEDSLRSAPKPTIDAVKGLIDGIGYDARSGKISVRAAKAHMNNLGKRGFESGEAGTTKSAARVLRKTLHDKVFKELEAYPDVHNVWQEANEAWSAAEDLSKNRTRMKQEYIKKTQRSKAKLIREKAKIANERKKLTNKFKKQVKAEVDKSKEKLGQEMKIRMEEEYSSPQKAITEQAQKAKTKALREKKAQLREYHGPPETGTKTEELVKAVAKKAGWQATGTAIGHIVGTLLGLPTGAKTLLSLGGGAVGHAAKVWRAVRSVMKEHPDIYKSWKNGVNEAYRGNLAPLHTIVPMIDSMIKNGKDKKG